MIVVERLTKRYGPFVAVDDVSFACHPGQVVGFLGPNGAGKSTTLRVLTGLTPATSGSATIGGYAYRDIPNPAMQVGTLLDASAFHSGRSARETLRLSAQMMGLPTSRVDEMLAVVGLSPSEAGRRVANYSLGMRQRLGVANALLGDPSVLILDEPVNGLDPAGIHWMRGVLRGFADAGGTVLLSSHLLHEIELIADHIVVIGGGRVMAQGTKESLAGMPGTQVRAVDETALAAALGAAGLPCRPGTSGGIVVDASTLQVGEVAAAAGLVLTELASASTGGLEQTYLQLTAAAQRGPLPAGPMMPPGQMQPPGPPQPPGQPGYPGQPHYPGPQSQQFPGGTA
ncbi:ATP-binding cassette domain-containing protein [Gordonia alkaliphila]|uniref:ABC transporter ATP-binding protein n=1 Tax=Gordonia alkaliphila TaxID=1053547 RepID=UPI001FF4BCE2|nr:ATP-binding cassette domain-containing protein [Gordonia alkaliphila]MCK0439306.1 ATP-binding cassette domain-containing protein [Gordonia alkaliphila]